MVRWCCVLGVLPQISEPPRSRLALEAVASLGAYPALLVAVQLRGPIRCVWEGAVTLAPRRFWRVSDTQGVWVDFRLFLSFQ